MKNSRAALAAWLVAAAWSACACESEVDGRKIERGDADGYQGWQFEWDNDSFARTDRWFTNALRLSQVYCRRAGSTERLTDRLSDVGQHLLGAAVTKGDETLSSRLGVVYTVGQLMYTPARIVDSRPQRFDRPWAGALYGAITVFGYKGNDFQATDLKLGLTGRASLADRTQREWHRFVGADRPEGWEHQLRSRPFLQLGHLRLRRFGDTGASDRFGFHLGGAGAVGTHRSYASLLGGMSVGRLGGKNPVFAVGNDGDLIIQDLGDRESFRNVLFFTNVSLTAVAHNRFITGDTAAGPSDVRLRHGVAAWQAGVSLPLGRSWRVLYSHTVRTPEFRSRVTDRVGGTQRWGTVSLNYDAL